MTYDQILRTYGGPAGSLAAAAKRLNIPKTTLASWRLRGVPRGRQFEIRARSRGRLSVERVKPRG